MKLAAMALPVIFAIGTSWAQAQTSSSLSSADKSFATHAAEAGISEVAEAQIALQKSSSQQVKDFAQRMVTDHTKANDQLKQIAQQEGLTLPTDATSRDKRQAAALDKAPGGSFDKSYVKDQKTAHQKAVALFSKEARSGSDPALKSFATQTLPVLQDHLRMVTTLASGK